MRALLASALLAAYAAAVLLAAVLPLAFAARTADLPALVAAAAEESPAAARLFVVAHVASAALAYRIARRRAAAGAAAGALGALAANAATIAYALWEDGRRFGPAEPVLIGLTFGGLVVLLGATLPVLAARRLA